MVHLFEGTHQIWLYTPVIFHWKIVWKSYVGHFKQALDSQTNYSTCFGLYHTEQERNNNT